MATASNERNAEASYDLKFAPSPTPQMTLTHAPAQLLPLAVGPAGDGLVHVDTVVRQEVTKVRSRSSLQGDVRLPFLFDRYIYLFRWVLGP